MSFKQTTYCFNLIYTINGSVNPITGKSARDLGFHLLRNYIKSLIANSRQMLKGA